MTKTERINHHYMMDALRRLEWDMANEVVRQQRIPADWHRISLDRGRKAKVRVTMGLEEDVVRFFKSMGRGYQERMNDVRRAFRHATLAGIVAGPDVPPEVREGPRPEWGDTRRAVEGID